MRLIALCLPLLLAAPALAERYHLRVKEADQETIQVVDAAPVGELEGREQVRLIDVRGKTQEVELSAIVKVEEGHPLPERIERKRLKLRQRLLSRQGKEVSKLLRRYKRTPKEERPEVLAELERWPPAARVGPYAKELDDADSEVLVQLALKEMPKLKGVDAERPLVKTAVLSKHPKLRARAHYAACQLDQTRTRDYYAQVATLQTLPERRVRAMEYLAGMGEVAAPSLVFVLEKVEMEINATQVTAGGLRRVPVNLGSRGGAAIDAPIELPEASMLQVKTKVVMHTLREIQGRARAALKSISGEDHGTDGKAWRAWLDERPRRVEGE